MTPRAERAERELDELRRRVEAVLNAPYCEFPENELAYDAGGCARIAYFRGRDHERLEIRRALSGEEGKP